MNTKTKIALALVAVAVGIYVYQKKQEAKPAKVVKTEQKLNACGSCGQA